MKVCLAHTRRDATPYPASMLTRNTASTHFIHEAESKCDAIKYAGSRAPREITLSQVDWLVFGWPILPEWSTRSSGGGQIIPCRIYHACRSMLRGATPSCALASPTLAKHKFLVTEITVICTGYFILSIKSLSNRAVISIEINNDDSGRGD